MTAAYLVHAGRARAVRRLLEAGVAPQDVRDALDAQDADRDDPCRVCGDWSRVCGLCGQEHPCDC